MLRLSVPSRRLDVRELIKENTWLRGPQGWAQKTKMKTLIAALFLLLSSTPANSFAGGWVLMTPDLTIGETEVTTTKKWVVLESFATVLQCNDRRSSLIRQIDKERRELRDVEDDSAAIESERELRLLWYVYTYSKCVSSR
jgi:hypothetical protein